MMSQAKTPERDETDPSGSSEVGERVDQAENESGETSQALTNYNVKWDELYREVRTLDTVEKLNGFVNNLPYIKNTDEGKAIVERAHALAPPRNSTVAAPRSIDVSQQEQLSVEDLFQFAQNVNTKTDNELRSVLSSISNRGDREIRVYVLLLKKELTSRMRERENELMRDLHSYIYKVTSRATTVRHYLMNFAGLSQETKGTTPGKRKSDQITKSSSVRPQNNEGGLNQNPPELVCIEAQSNIQMVKNIFEYVGDLDGYSQTELTEVERDFDDIRECMQLYNRCFKEGTFKDTEKDDPQPAVELFKEFAKYKREQRRKKIEGEHFREKTIDDWFTPQLNLTLHGPTSGESHGVQPLFEALLRSISAGLPFACERKSGKRKPESGLGSPKKGYVSPQVKIEEEVGPHRRPDIVLWSRGKHLAVMDMDKGEMKLTFELKPGRRIGQDPMTLYDEVRNQGLSHAAKFLKKAFDFGPGVAAHCTFVVATPVYMQVMKLFLEKPGTPKCDVKLRSSKMLPLVSKKNFEKYFGSHVHKKKVKDLMARIYTDDLCENPEKLAFLAIRKLMKSSRQDLVGIKMDGIELIGCGTFGTILVPKGEDVNGVLKVAKFGCEEVLLQELNVLESLRPTGGDMLAGDANVIKLVEFKNRIMDFGGTKMQIPCLHLSPKGVSAYDFSEKDLKGKTRMIVNDLKRGLDFIHGRGYVHNDISLKNFVIVPDTNGKDEAERAVIIDLGSAKRENVKMSGRVGTPDFAHKDYFELSCISRRECDLASLAFVIHVVHNGGVTPWTPIDHFNEERDDMTKEWLRGTFNDAGLNDMKGDLIQCIDFSSNDGKTEAIN